jgi:small nuclear ribonucleoprotein (snRNP)-like protein
VLVVGVVGPADFSDEYRGCRVKVETSIGVVVEGILVEASRYWFKVRTDKGVVYINKTHVVLVTPVASPSGCRGGRVG